MIVFVILATLSCLAYANSFHVPFHFDDLRLIRFNFSLRDLGGWKAIFSSEPFRPLLVATFALNFKLGNSDPFTYHVFNLLFHVVAVSLFFVFVRRISKSALLPFAAAAWMAVHPLNTESVTYISSRSIVLCADFYLASLLCFDTYVEKKNRPALLFFCLFFILAMITKEEGALIPFTALLYNGFIKGGDSLRKHKLLHVLTCMFVLVIGGLRMVLFFKLTPDLPYSYFTWTATQITVWVRYFRLACLPVSLNVDPDISQVSVGTPVFWIASSLVAGLIVLCVRLRKTQPGLAFWGLWFFLNLLASSAVPLADFSAEHRVYISLFGFCAAGASVAFLVLEKYPKAELWIKTALVLVIAFCVLGTFERNRVWNSELTLWKDAVLKSPRKIRPHLNLAGSFFNLKQYDPAIREYEFVKTLNPANAQIYAGLGICYLRKGDLPAAEAAFHQALFRDPTMIDPKTGLGMIRYSQGKFEEALAYFRQIYPYRRESVQLVDRMSDSCMRTGNYREAIAILERAVTLPGAHPSFYSRLGEAYDRIGESEKAKMLKP